MFSLHSWMFAVLLGCVPVAALAADPIPAPSPTAPVAEIRTPPAPPTPRINGPRAYGARPGHPFLYHLPVTGERPMQFAAKGLPGGLMIDPETGNVSGSTTERGTHPVEFTATNARGTDKATINLVVGNTICLTPPLGWNSWNHFARNVSEQDVRDAADAMVSSKLIEHGWTYVNIDDCWQGERDADENIHGNAKFPDLKALGDYVHAKGLKFGLYSSPGPKTCAGYPGSYEREDQDARTYAEWGVDYVKYDLCSYADHIHHLAARQTTAFQGRGTAYLTPEQQTAYEALTKEQAVLQGKPQRLPAQDARLATVNTELGKLKEVLDLGRKKDLNLQLQQDPYRLFAQSLAKVPRDIVYSLCQYGNADVWEWGASVGGNSWRTTSDIHANWKSMSGIGFEQDRLAKFAGPGHWNDPDMLEIGNAGLTPDECYTHMTLWCMLSAPLLIGCDMSRMDPFTVSLFSNDEVIAVDQDALGKQGYRLKAEGTTEIWVKPLASGDAAIALFNRGDQPVTVSVPLGGIHVTPHYASVSGGDVVVPFLRDLWRQKNLPRSSGGDVQVRVNAHGAELLRYASGSMEANLF